MDVNRNDTIHQLLLYPMGLLVTGRMLTFLCVPRVLYWAWALLQALQRFGE